MSGFPSTGKLLVSFSLMRWPGSWWPERFIYHNCLISLYFSQWQHKTVDSTAPKAASVKFEELSEQTWWINVDLSSNPGKHTEVVEAVFLHLWLNKYIFSVNLSSKIDPPPIPSPSSQHRCCHSYVADWSTQSWPTGILRCPFPCPAQLESRLICFRDLIKSFPVLLRRCHYPPSGMYFASDRNMAFSPLRPLSQPHFSGTCQH